MRKIFALITIFILTIGYVHLANAAKISKPKTKIITVEKSTPQKNLYFSGIIEPYQKYAIISPTDGVIIKQFFHFGQNIQKDDKLFVIDSTKQHNDYQDALVNFLKAKQTLNESETKYNIDSDFWKKDIISRDEYNKSRSSYLLDKLAYMQAKAKLAHITGTDKHINSMEQLNLKNIDHMSGILELDKKSRKINILAPVAGIVLFGESDKVKLGATVKENQTLIYLGSIEKLTTNIEISEINVNQLHAGQPVIVTGDAFPQFNLHGYISSIAAQASSKQEQPTFSARIIIPKLTEEQEQIIKMGMSIKITIPISIEPKIMIPITAINPDDQTVQIINPITKKITQMKVQTGETTLEDVIITSGLKEGDKIIVPDTATDEETK